MNPTTGLTRQDFACKCGCGGATVDYELAGILRDLEYQFGDLIVTSGYRCEKHNKSVGGVTGSMHTQGRAADIQSVAVEANVVQEYLLEKYPDKYGIGRYNTFTHIDSRSIKGRWDKRSR